MAAKNIVWLFLCALICDVHASTEYNRYLAQIFQKYGNGGTITFEGLEHLMYSLGLGQLEFEPTHTIDEHRPQTYNASKINASGYNVSRFLEQGNKTIFDDAVGDVQLQTSLDSRGTESQNDVNNNQTEFRELHDPKHRHPRDNYVPLDDTSLPSTAICLSPRSLLSLLVDHNDLHTHKIYRKVLKDTNDGHNSEDEYNDFINSVRITPKAFMKLCPALLAQIDNGVCARPVKLELSAQEKKDKFWNACIYAIISMVILSVCGLLGILLAPLMKTAVYQEVLKFLVAIAVGTLSGDALMHLLPHALFKEEEHEHASEDSDGQAASENSHGHNNEAVLLCAVVFFAALFMYVLENFIPVLKGKSGGHGHSHHGHGHGHEHNVTEKSVAVAAEASPPLELNIMLQETKLDEKMPDRPFTPIALMVIIGDGLHNLTDGMAIGAAFATDPITGFATAFAVLCHELPHELGDFALLLQTGVSIRRATYMNIISSVLGFLGMAFGLWIAGVAAGMTQWIYAITAGSFLYIAFADLIPTMSIAHNPHMMHDGRGILIHILGILCGGLIMLVIALKEHELEALFKNF